MPRPKKPEPTIPTPAEERATSLSTVTESINRLPINEVHLLVRGILKSHGFSIEDLAPISAKLLAFKKEDWKGGFPDPRNAMPQLQARIGAEASLPGDGEGVSADV